MTGTANVTSSHLAFSYGTGLDGHLWAFLHDASGRSIDDLAQLTGRSHRVLRDKLRNLDAAGLARFDGDHWYRIGDAHTLDRVAVERGLVESAARRATRHRIQREQHRARPVSPSPAND